MNLQVILNFFKKIITLSPLIVVMFICSNTLSRNCKIYDFEFFKGSNCSKVIFGTSQGNKSWNRILSVSLILKCGICSNSIFNFYFGVVLWIRGRELEV